MIFAQEIKILNISIHIKSDKHASDFCCMTCQPMDNQAISYLSVVWVLYSPLFPIIALPQWQVDRECFCSWSVHLLSDIRNIFALTAVWNLYASESLSVFILSCAQKRLFKPLASIGALASRTLPTPHHPTTHVHWTRRDHLQRSWYNQQNGRHC